MNKFIVFGTTSKHSPNILRLPNKQILGTTAENYLINSKEEILKIVNNNTLESSFYIADCERKQSINIYNYLKSLDNIDKPVIDYKPNDLTMEAADLTILNYFKNDLSQKSVAIYGTGNISFKLALRLSERDIKIYLYGRNKEKVRMYVEMLKYITFDSELVEYGSFENKVDAFVSFISAENIIDAKYLNILNKNSLCIDGGIGNLSSDFIKLAIENNHDVRRLDVRQSQEIMDGYINSRINSQFSQIIGRDIINKHTVVAGGIMGKDGEVIVDKIMNPVRVIGIANGIGGVKNEFDLSTEERNKIREVQSIIEQSIQKNNRCKH